MELLWSALELKVMTMVLQADAVSTDRRPTWTAATLPSRFGRGDYRSRFPRTGLRSSSPLFYVGGLDL